MSFHLTAQDIRVEDHHYLVGELQNEDGKFNQSSIDLDEFLGNDNGQFQWDGVNFSETAGNVHFRIEGDGEVPVLRAELQNVDGRPVPADINLSERIENDNGNFVFN